MKLSFWQGSILNVLRIRAPTRVELRRHDEKPFEKSIAITGVFKQRGRTKEIKELKNIVDPVEKPRQTSLFQTASKTTGNPSCTTPQVAQAQLCGFYKNWKKANLFFFDVSPSSLDPIFSFIFMSMFHLNNAIQYK
jgi:hypothetical protein